MSDASSAPPSPSGAPASPPSLSLAPAPAPAPAELAAIVAALDAVWPRPAPATSAEPERPGKWRFSGRWWSRPHTVQRARPWVERTP